MTEIWKPTEGLKRAETVAAQIKEELAAAGVQIEPMYQWRMAQVIGKAIDEAVSPVRGALDKSMMDSFASIVSGQPVASINGNGTLAFVADGLVHMASEISDSMSDETPPAGAIHAAEEAPKRRGRPPGPGKKKDKKAAKKKADAGVSEAAQAA